MNFTQKINKPELILGTVQLGLAYGINNKTGVPSLDTSLQILDEARKGGIRSIDTAEAYGKSIEVIKTAFDQGLKFKVFTKIKPGVSEIRNYINRLLEDLGVNSLEGLSLHSLFQEYTEDQIDELQKLKKEGLIKSLGVSVYTTKEAIDASVINEIDLVQLPYNLLDNWQAREKALKALKSKNKMVHIRSVFLQGMFFKANPPVALASSVHTLQTLGEGWPGGLPQMAMDFVKENVFIDGVLVGAETVEQVKANCLMWNRKNAQCPWPYFGKLDSETQSALDPRNWK